eukprot:CAMPEP_0169240140 /NCGR_PEP_ID=MMETSP1016-20121227/31295_1 /TAXON_ID=342587 /ORGANISM="Karlodinium micrum, Strain CCMP2283" /LENGTH=389 /DNA_ID=CAMNT_0009320139 /DNA_START=39 /DNA_END=1206 /DNA_ORIENTATION=-
MTNERNAWPSSKMPALACALTALPAGDEEAQVFVDSNRTQPSTVASATDFEPMTTARSTSPRGQSPQVTSICEWILAALARGESPQNLASFVSYTCDLDADLLAAELFRQSELSVDVSQPPSRSRQTAAAMRLSSSTASAEGGAEPRSLQRRMDQLKLQMDRLSRENQLLREEVRGRSNGSSPPRFYARSVACPGQASIDAAMSRDSLRSARRSTSPNVVKGVLTQVARLAETPRTSPLSSSSMSRPEGGNSCTVPVGSISSRTRWIGSARERKDLPTASQICATPYSGSTDEWYRPLLSKRRLDFGWCILKKLANYDLIDAGSSEIVITADAEDVHVGSRKLVTAMGIVARHQCGTALSLMPQSIPQGVGSGPLQVQSARVRSITPPA